MYPIPVDRKTSKEPKKETTSSDVKILREAHHQSKDEKEKKEEGWGGYIGEQFIKMRENEESFYEYIKRSD